MEEQGEKVWGGPLDKSFRQFCFFHPTGTASFCSKLGKALFPTESEFLSANSETCQNGNFLTLKSKISIINRSSFVSILRSEGKPS